MSVLPPPPPPPHRSKNIRNQDPGPVKISPSLHFYYDKFIFLNMPEILNKSVVMMIYNAIFLYFVNDMPFLPKRRFFFFKPSLIQFYSCILLHLRFMEKDIHDRVASALEVDSLGNLNISIDLNSTRDEIIFHVELPSLEISYYFEVPRFLLLNREYIGYSRGI